MPWPHDTRSSDTFQVEGDSCNVPGSQAAGSYMLAMVDPSCTVRCHLLDTPRATRLKHASVGGSTGHGRRAEGRGSSQAMGRRFEAPGSLQCFLRRRPIALTP